jgi:hypothetical protein
MFELDIRLKLARIPHNQPTCPTRASGMNPLSESPGVNAVIG